MPQRSGSWRRRELAYRLVADLGFQTTDPVFVFVVLARLQCRLAARKKVIALAPA